MGIDTSIYRHLLQPVRSVAEYDDDAQVRQSNALALQMGRAKADEYTRGVESQNVLQGAVRGFGSDTTANYNALLRTGNLPAAQKYQMEILEQQKVEAETQGKRGTVVDAGLKRYRSMLDYVETPEAAGRWMQAQYQDPEIGGYVQQMLGPFDPAQVPDAQTFPQWRERAALGMDQHLKKLQDDARIAETGRSNTAREGIQIRGQDRQSADAAASRAVQMRGQNLVNDRAREAAANAGSGGGKPMTELQVLKRRDQIAKDHKAALTTLASMDELVTSANEVLTAPGLSGATGVQSYFPSWPDGGAARAEVKLKNLEGKVTQLGKQAAAMAGAIGPMAVQEWKIVRDMIAAIEPQKGEEALKEQIRIVEATAQGAAQRIREGYERQYATDFERFPEFQGLPEPGQKAGGSSGGLPSMEAIEAELQRRQRSGGASGGY